MSSDEVRSGIGYDVHAFTPGRPLMLGGVRIDHTHGLIGHSDADVLLHAIADALLGAAGLGDIGQHFPPDDPSYENADSRTLLATVGGLVRAQRWEVNNVDATVVAEAPRLSPYAAAMRKSIARCLALEASSINVKATTNEGMGFIGRAEGIGALAIATIRRTD